MELIKEKAVEAYQKIWLGTMDGIYDHHQYRNIVLHEQKAVYYFIPKVACSTLKKVFAKALGIYEEGRDVQYLNYPTMPHWKLKRHRDYFKFCFVRNPWDRLVSAYSNKISQDPGQNDAVFENGVPRIWKKFGVFYPGMDFASFAAAVARIPDSEAEAHFRSQSAFFKNASGDIPMDFVGRFENLDEDFRLLCQKIGLEEAGLEHRNRSRRKAYQSYYDDKTRRLVEERYQEDIRRFGYSFGNVQPVFGRLGKVLQ